MGCQNIMGVPSSQAQSRLKELGGMCRARWSIRVDMLICLNIFIYLSMVLIMRLIQFAKVHATQHRSSLK